MVADGGVAQYRGYGGAVAGAGLVSVFSEGHVPDPMETIFDMPVPACPLVEVDRLGVGGGQGDDQVGRLAGGGAGDGAGDQG